ncbi:MAG: formate dehydrogenase subunit alpha [Candidatus Thermoplasmatota archaeon]|nr:formate dehydrogenase subunit alpha [Candidatus Thermoplasmatota archaeon]
MSIHVTINGIRTDAEDNSTVLQIARKMGIEVPALCDRDGHVNGVCRLCMVETDNAGKTAPSCSTRVKEGMEIRTSTSHLNTLRKGILRLLINQHGHHQDAGNLKCTLEKYAEEYGISSAKKQGKPRIRDLSHPAIAFDPSLCILCRKCLLACDFDQLNDVIALSGRGNETTVAFDLDLPMGNSSCVSCGACVDVCPTGALIEKDWQPAERTVTTICPYCAVGCSVEYGITRDNIVWARGSDTGIVNKGKLCVKGKFGYQFELSQDRLKVPLIRRDGAKRERLDGTDFSSVFREASWKEALDLIASKIMDIKGRNGGVSIGGIASDRSTNEDIFAFQKFMRAVVGSDNVDQSATLCHAPSASMLSLATGAGASTNSIEDIENARTIVMVGSNVDRAHPVISSFIKKAARNGANLIVVDPRKVELTRHADMILNLKPGTDVALFSAIARYIIDMGWADEKFIEERTEGFAEYVKSLEPFTIDMAVHATGLLPDHIKEVARIYATEKPSLIMWTLGITEHENGSDNVSSLVNLALLTGNVGVPGSGLDPIRGQNNVQGGADVGCVAGSLPGYQPYLDPETRSKFENKWNRKLPNFTGWKSVDMIEASMKGLIKFMYISGENTVRSHPDSAYVAEAFKKLDFLVVQDIFLTETAEYADVVLPAASSFEKTGTYTNTERRVQLIQPLFTPPGLAKPDWQIYSELAERLGYDMGFESSEAIMDEVAALVPIYAGISHARLGRNGLQWPVTASEHPGTSTLHVGKFISGKGKFRILRWREPDKVSEYIYPYVLITGRQREHYHTATMTSRSKIINDLAKGGLLEMNADDMSREGIKEGEKVELISQAGRLYTVVKASSDLQRGTVFTTFHYAEMSTNVLTSRVFDSPTRTPAYKDTRVRIRKIPET